MKEKEKAEDNHVKKFISISLMKSSKSLGSKIGLREMIWQGKGNKVVEEGPDLEEMMLCRCILNTAPAHDFQLRS